MTGWTVMWRGLRYRAGRSLVVALLAAVAVAAAVLAPGYSRAAQQSVLTDGLHAAPPAAAGLLVTAAGTAAGAPATQESTVDTRLAVDAALAQRPVLAGRVGPAVAGVDTDTVATGGAEPLAARLAYRDNVCQHLVIAGSCPIDAGQVLVSARTADTFQIRPGDPLTIGSATVQRQVEVVGTYTPPDATAPYWGNTAYFTFGGFDPVTGAPRVDAIFTAAEDDVRADADAVVNLSLTYPLRADQVRLDDVAALRADLRALDGAVRVGDRELTTALPAILDGVAGDADAIARTVPVVAVPLLLLSWFVLFLLIAALTEERGPEIALAKLRGFASGRAARFGLGEVLVLVVLAAPVGVGLGLAAVELAAQLALAEGTHVELRWPVLAAAAVALAASASAAVLAGRTTLRRGVLTLLRRVPHRTRWQAGVAEAAVVALAAASLVAALSDRSAPLALLAPALLAVVAGIAAARLVRHWSALRLRLARRRGRIPALLSAAQLSRRPGGQRVIVVVTVAVALLAFSATAWDVAAQARRDQAVDSVGADRVYAVLADHPAALVAAVRQADPAGTSMAVVRASDQYAGQRVELLAVDATALTTVATWRGQDSDQVAALAAALRPAAPEPLLVAEQIEVTARVSDLGAAPVRFTAVVSAPGEPPRPVSLGILDPEVSRYAAALPECPAGCRLLGFGLTRTGGAGGSGGLSATVAVSAIRSAGQPLAARFDEADAWRAAAAPAVSVRPGAVLRVVVAPGHSGDVFVAHQDTLAALPAALAGAALADDPGATQFSFPGFGEQPQPFTVVHRAPRLPRAGPRGLLFDLDHAVRAAERTAGLADNSALRYEVWAHADAPANLDRRLGAAGITVLGGESVAGVRDQLGRRAPALGWWLYLLAGVAATALALGVALLSTSVGADTRRGELAALRTAGVPRRLLRRGLLREQVALLGVPLIVGFAVGVAGAVLMLPGLALVSVGVVTAHPAYRPEFGALPAAAVAAALGLLLAAGSGLRLAGRDRTRREGTA